MGNTLMGVDISSHNGSVNWKNISTGFVMIRAGWSWYQGGMNIDTKFLENIKGAIESKIPFGIYLYAYDLTPEAARISASRLADLLDKYLPIPYPIAYDFEDNQYLSKDKELNTKICDLFLKTLKSRGYYPMLYTYTNFANSYLNMDNLTYDFWVADYRNQLGYTKEHGMWQFSSTGRVAGISTQVDMNYCYKDYPTLIENLGLNGYDSPSTDQKATLNEFLKELKELIERYE